MDEIKDLFAIKIITKQKQECYMILGIINTLYNLIPGTFKDYIATPRNNMYEAIHEIVLGEKGVELEVQICSYTMNKIAKYGINGIDGINKIRDLVANEERANILFKPVEIASEATAKAVFEKLNERINEMEEHYNNICYKREWKNKFDYIVYNNYDNESEKTNNRISKKNVNRRTERKDLCKMYFELDEDFNKIILKNLEDVEKIRLIPTGWTNIVFEVTTENNKSYFFRFPRDEFWARTIVKDYQFAKYIHNKTDFDTVELQLLYDKGRPFSMHRKIEGTPLAERMNELNESEIENISSEIAKFMFQLHSIKYEKDKIFTINNIGVNLTEFLDELLKKHVSKDDMAFWNFRDEDKNHLSCLVHGDLNSSNVLLNNDNHVTAIIDFGFGGFGNKYDDISRIIGRCPNNFKRRNYKKHTRTNSNSKCWIHFKQYQYAFWRKR